MRRAKTWIETRQELRRSWLEAMRAWAIEWRKCYRDGDHFAACDALLQAVKARRYAREVYR